MKSLVKATYIFGVLLVISVMLMPQNAESAAKVDRTVSVTGNANRPVTAEPLLDDFRYGAPLNVWSCTTGTFAVNNGTCAASYTSDPAITHGGTGNSLKLAYNVTALTSYSGYYSKLGSSNLAAYTTISFWVKGEAGGEFFKVELKNTGADDNTNHAAVYVTDYLDGGVKNTWKQVTIPLHAFANISDWSSGKEFCITFEGDASRTNGITTPTGTVYIDDITFGSGTVAAVRVDHFGDKLSICALGGNMWGSTGTTTYTFPSSSTLYYHNNPNGLKFDYDVSGASDYTVVSAAFGGGNDGFQKIPHNFGAYTKLTFYIRAASSAKNPEGIKVELHDFKGVGVGEPFYVIKKTDMRRITTSWQQFSINLSDFKNWPTTDYPSGVQLDKTRIAEIVFTIERGNAVDQTGTVYIDEVQFE